MVLSHAMNDKVKFTATVVSTTTSPPQYTILEIRLPVAQCDDHKYNETDEETPDAPHVHSTSEWHQDYAVCLGVI